MVRAATWAGIGALVAAMFSSPAAVAATAAYIDSPPGDWVGQGQELTFTSPATAISAASVSGNSLVTVSWGSWRLQFESAGNAALAPGNYEGATRYPFNSNRYPGLSVSGESRGCNELQGWFKVHEAAFAGTSVLSFAVDFVQSCDGGPALFGAVRFNSDVPLARPEPYARATGPQVATEGDSLALEAYSSFDRATGIAAYEWAQDSGTPVTLANADTALATFTAPDVAPGGETLGFTVKVTDTDGNVDWAEIEVRVHDVADPRTRAKVDSGAGDYIGQGLTYWYDEATASITTGNASSVVNVTIDGLERWNVSFALPSGANWSPGMYGGARRYPFQQSNQPGLSFSGEGSACNTLSGWYEIVEVQIVGGSVLRLAVDFVQHCEQGAPRLFGAIRINSSVPLEREVAYAVVAPTPPATEGEEVVLDGSGSDARTGELTYQWTQLAGTPVVLAYANSLAATFIAPQVAPNGETLTFQLTVTDEDGHADTHTVDVRIHDTTDPRTRAYIDSPAGDWVGGGSERSFSAPTSSFTSSVANGNAYVTVAFDGWSMDFEAPAGRTLVPGNFEGATRYPFNAATEPGLDVNSPGRGCNQLEGWFRIHEALYSGATVLRFAADFVQSCDGGPPLFGSVRINSAIPPELTTPYARARTQGAVTEGEDVLLAGSASFDRSGSIASYEWTQLEGPAATITGANTSLAQFTAPSVTTRQTLRFRLVVTDDDGNADEATVAVEVHDTSGPRTRARIESQPGDWVGQGLTYTYDESSTAFTTSLGSALRVDIDGAERWTAQFALPNGGTWQPGSYAIATRYPFQSPYGPGLNFAGEGRGCNELSGWFEVIEVEIVGSSVLSLAVDFAQHCENGTPNLFGAIRINSSVPLDRGVPHAIPASERFVQEGQPMELDASLSYSLGGGPLAYKWTQISGQRATFTAPNNAHTEVSYGGVPVTGAEYTFRLEVTDGAGVKDTETVQVRVRSRWEPQTYLVVDSDPADWVGAGDQHTFTSDSSTFTEFEDFGGGLHIRILNHAHWALHFIGPKGGPLQVGRYEQAQRYPFQAAGHPGLDYSGDGRGCNAVTGRFEVRQVSYKTDGSVLSAAIDFEQHCEGGAPALRGKLRINYAPVNEPLADVGGGGGPMPPSTLLAALALALLRQRRTRH